MSFPIDQCNEYYVKIASIRQLIVFTCHEIIPGMKLRGWVVVVTAFQFPSILLHCTYKGTAVNSDSKCHFDLSLSLVNEVEGHSSGHSLTNFYSIESFNQVSALTQWLRSNSGDC